MALETPTIEPETIVAGDTVKFIKELSDFLPVDSWVLKYSLVKDGARIDITSPDNGDGRHLVNEAKAASLGEFPAR